MRAELKFLSSPDIDLLSYLPVDESNFGFLLEALIGPEGLESSEIFQILVCTPDWIKGQYKAEKTVWGRHMLIVFEYDISEIKCAIDRYIERCAGSDWEDVASKLSRIAGWEFEDYQA